MNDNPHLMAIIESKLAQARTCGQNNDPARVGDLLRQVQIYAESLSTGAADAGPGRPVLGRSPSGAC